LVRAVGTFGSVGPIGGFGKLGPRECERGGVMYEQTRPGPAPTVRRAIQIALGGAALCVIGVFLPFVKGTNDLTGLSETINGTEKLGVGLARGLRARVGRPLGGRAAQP
jgi:hypothetical protein